jgi:cadmium resistance protein CadD (predicted permease)
MTAIVSFAATNADDFILLMILSADGVSDKISRRHIWLGQFISIGLITGLGLLGSILLGFLPKDFDGYLFWLGLLPLGLGVFHLIETFIGSRYRRRQKRRAKVMVATKGNLQKKKITVGHIFAMLFSAGADNVGVYIPLFAKMDAITKTTSVIMFMLLTWLICFLALRISSNQRIEKIITHTESVLVPIILILIGLGILLGI